MSGDENGESQHTRLLFPMSFYSDHKDEVKAPIKELGLKWQFLGRDGDDTKGRYSGDGVQVFARFTDSHADFTVWGEDTEAVETILEAWSEMPTVEPDEDEAPKLPQEEAKDKAVKVWEFKKPTQRPGEPDGLYQRRLEDWEAEDPRKG